MQGMWGKRESLVSWESSAHQTATAPLKRGREMLSVLDSFIALAPFQALSLGFHAPPPAWLAHPGKMPNHTPTLHPDKPLVNEVTSWYDDVRRKC